MMKILLLSALIAFAPGAFAQASRDTAGGAERWNITGPAWYETKCGGAGMTNGVGIGQDKWVKPCSIPVRVCEFEKMTISTPALPDVSCEKMATWAGPVRRTELRRWD